MKKSFGIHFVLAAMVALAVAVTGCGDDGGDGTAGTGGSGGGTAGTGGSGGGTAGTGGSGGGTAGTGGSGGTGGEGGTGGGGTPISFATDIQPYFTDNCVGCHSGDVSERNGVRLNNYDNIVLVGGGTCSATTDDGCNVDAECPSGETCDTFPLVVPFEPANPTATLIPQLEANHFNGPDDAGFVDNFLSPWISEGALDN